MQTTACTNSAVTSTVLASSLQFSCIRCGEGLYSLFGGSSNGTVGNATNFQCNPCPSGGSCLNSVVTATARHWGAQGALGVVTFASCPAGYCCDDVEWPCVSMSSCGGHRKGPLCGDCEDGYVESLGSSRCTPVTRCGQDRPILWMLVVVALLIIAAVHLTVVSGLGRSGDITPSGRLKLLIYYAQVRGSAGRVGDGW